MSLVVDFDSTMTRLVVEEMITQTVVPFNDETMDLRKGDVCKISFAGLEFKDYHLLICNASVTSLAKLSNQDLFCQGFLYRPFYEKFMLQRGIGRDDTVVKLDFKVVG